MGEVQICRDPGGGALPGKGAERVNWPEKLPVWRSGGTSKYTVRDRSLGSRRNGRGGVDHLFQGWHVGPLCVSICQSG